MRCRALVYADAELELIKRTEQLIAAVANAPRLGRIALDRAGIHPRDFATEDLVLIGSVIYAAGDLQQKPFRRKIIDLTCKSLLVEAGYWQPDNDLPMVGRGLWGPASLSRLLCSIGYNDLVVEVAIARYLHSRKAVNSAHAALGAA